MVPANMAKDWIVTRISTNKDPLSSKEFPLEVQGVNLNHESPEHGETKRYFHWRVVNVYDERYDIGHAVIDDNVPLHLLQECRRNG